MPKSNSNASLFRNRLNAGVSGVALALIVSSIAGPANALVVRDDVGVDGAVDTTNIWGGVGQMFNRRDNGDGTISTFLCTGQLINPRTVVFAQHCTSGVMDEGYGPGLTNHMGFSFNPTDTFTGFDDWRRDEFGVINDPLTGVWESLPDQDFYNVLQVQSVFNVAEPFPGGDVVMASFDTPAAGLPTYGMLFSPLTAPTHATVVGYGTNGVGSTGDIGGIDFKRRVGENMIDGLFSQNDFVAGVFNVPGADFADPSAEQLLYHVDFDRPDRTPGDCARGEFFGFGFGNDIVCNTPPFAGFQPLTWDNTSAILTNDQIDWYPGDALPNEAGTAGGDSGSALFADQIYSRPLITGVLSGGWVTGFFGVNGGYGDVSYYNPLFLFRDWLVQNNPYVYASARHGNGNWSDPSHWVQNMDPNYFYIDKFGRVRNGLPAQPEPGYGADRPKFGTVFDLDIPTDVEGQTGAAPAAPAASAASGLATASDIGVLGSAPQSWSAGGHSSSSGPTASVGAPTGPGSRNFVPNNDYGTYGTWTSSADGTARFYDVTLNNFGRTRVDMDVEIDNLTVSGFFSTLDVLAGKNLNALIAVDQNRGFVNVDGTVSAREYMLWGGVLTGDGTINTQTLYNVKGAMSAGGVLSTGELTINGDYVQSSHGTLLINIRGDRRGVSNDHIQVNGDASLAGYALTTLNNGSRILRWQDTFNVLSANNVIGNFDHVIVPSPVLYGVSTVNGGEVDIQIKARRIGSLFGAGSSLSSLGSALDKIRWGGGYSSLSNVFTLVDSSSFDNFATRLFSLTPQSAFSQAGLVTGFNNTFVQHLTARNAELRAGVRGVSYSGLRSAFANAERASGAPIAASGADNAFSQHTRAAPEENRLGMFISSRGFYNADTHSLTAGAFQNLSRLDPMLPSASYDPIIGDTTNYGDLTIGADYRLTDTMAVGVSMSTTKFDLASNAASPLSSSSVGLSAYATKYGRNWYVDGYYSVSQHEFTAARSTLDIAEELSPFERFNGAQAQSAPSARQTLAGVRSGYTFEPLKGLLIGPMASLIYSNTEFGSYTENGAGQFDLIVGERNLTSIATSAGASIQYNHVTSRGKLISAFSEFSVSHELGDTREVIPAAFALAPDAQFEIDRLLDPTWYSASAGLTFAASDKLSTSVVVGADLDRGPLSQYYTSMRFNFRF